MKLIFIVLIAFLKPFLLLGQLESVLLTKEFGKFKFEVIQKKTGKIVVCHHDGKMETIYHEQKKLHVDIQEIQQMGMFDSVFVMVYNSTNSIYWTGITWNGTSWRPSRDFRLHLPKYEKVEVKMLSNNSVSVNTEIDSSKFVFNLIDLSQSYEKLIFFKKTIGKHYIEVRAFDNFSYVFDYYDGIIDTILTKRGIFVNVKDIGIFENTFTMVYEDVDEGCILSKIWNGEKWKVNFRGTLYDIIMSGEPPTTLTILDEKTIRYQRRGETTIAKIDIENKKITQEKE
jgi:hypothetical protein